MLYTIAVILLILWLLGFVSGYRDRVVSGWVDERPTRRLIPMTA